jgi:hypothetical protein
MARLAGTSGKPGPLARLTPPAQRPAADRRGPHQPADRRADVPAEKTVKNYVSTLSGKLGLKQRTAAAAYAARILAASKLQSSPDMTIIDRKP